MSRRTIIDTIRKTRDWLLFLDGMGIKDLPRTPEIKKFLDGKDSAPEIAAQPVAVIPESKVPSQGFPGMAKMVNPDTNQVLEEIYSDLEGCTRCPLHEHRSRILPGHGEKNAHLFIVEDQPAGAEEAAGECIAGAAGELFDKMLAAIGLDRSKVYITSIVKCRPEKERIATTEEINTCLPFLGRQIAAVRPAVIFALGPLAARIMTGSSQPLFRTRGKFHDFHGTPLMVSFHPSYLLKNEEMKKGSWIDLQMIQKKLRGRQETTVT